MIPFATAAHVVARAATSTAARTAGKELAANFTVLASVEGVFKSFMHHMAKPDISENENVKAAEKTISKVAAEQEKVAEHMTEKKTLLRNRPRKARTKTFKRAYKQEHKLDLMKYRAANKAIRKARGVIRRAKIKSVFETIWYGIRRGFIDTITDKLLMPMVVTGSLATLFSLIPGLQYLAIVFEVASWVLLAAFIYREFFGRGRTFKRELAGVGIKGEFPFTEEDVAPVKVDDEEIEVDGMTKVPNMHVTVVADGPKVVVAEDQISNERLQRGTLLEIRTYGFEWSKTHLEGHPERYETVKKAARQALKHANVTDRKLVNFLQGITDAHEALAGV